MEASSRTLAARLSRALARAFAALRYRDRRRAFARELFFRVAHRFTTAVAVESHGARYFTSTGDRGVGMTLFMGDDVERRTLGHALRVLKEEGIKAPNSPTIIDVGAHVGTTTITALSGFGFERAICFEPSPANRDLLAANIAYNDLGARVTVFPIALSDCAGKAEFEIAPMNPSDGRVRVRGTDEHALGEDRWPVVEVPTATLDSFVESGKLSLDTVGLVWIDAQGHEGHVLAGARSVLDRKIPTVIEFWPYALRCAGGLDGLLSLIEGHFRVVVDLGADGDVPEPPRSATQIPELAKKYRGIAQTDLLLIP
jgi:FkbM family methyltransferase